MHRANAGELDLSPDVLRRTGQVGSHSDRRTHQDDRREPCVRHDVVAVSAQPPDRLGSGPLLSLSFACWLWIEQRQGVSAGERKKLATFREGLTLLLLFLGARNTESCSPRHAGPSGSDRQRVVRELRTEVYTPRTAECATAVGCGRTAPNSSHGVCWLSDPPPCEELLHVAPSILHPRVTPTCPPRLHELCYILLSQL